MTDGQILIELKHMTGTRGWQDVLLPEIKSRYESALISIMHTAGQTDANIHKAAGLAAAYDYLIRGIPEWIQNLAVSTEEEIRTQDGVSEIAPPIM